MRIACPAIAKMNFEQSDKMIQIETETKPRMVVVSFSSPGICLSALKELLDITQFFESDIRKQQWTVLSCQLRSRKMRAPLFSAMEESFVFISFCWRV